MSVKSEYDAILRELAEDSGPVMKLLAQMNAGALDQADIDDQTALLIRFAALVALDAAPASYLIHLALGEQAGIDARAIQATLVALAPLVGSARITAAVGKISEAVRMAQAV